MSQAAKSLYYFGYYLLLLGLVLIVYPNTLLSLFQMAETQEVWIRVLGIPVFNIGLIYIFMGPANNTLFNTLSVYTRASVLVWFIVFVLIGWAAPSLILFGVVDALGAAWTYTALRKS